MSFKMVSGPSFEFMSFNQFLAKDCLNDFNQDLDANLNYDISSVEINYLSPCKID